MGEWMYRSTFSWDLDTSWRWVVSFTPLPLYTPERVPGTHFIGGGVDPRAGLDDMEKWKFLALPGLELPPPGRPARSQSLYRLSYPGSFLPKLIIKLQNRLFGRVITHFLNRLPAPGSPCLFCTRCYLKLRFLVHVCESYGKMRNYITKSLCQINGKLIFCVPFM
jgi:hypothetical protein